MNDHKDTVQLKLATALRERIAIIEDETSRKSPTVHMERLREISERIEDLKSQLPKPIPAQLAHYLEKASYAKALEYLDGRGY